VAVRCVFPSEPPDPKSVLIEDSGDYIAQTTDCGTAVCVTSVGAKKQSVHSRHWHTFKITSPKTPTLCNMKFRL